MDVFFITKLGQKSCETFPLQIISIIGLCVFRINVFDDLNALNVVSLFLITIRIRSLILEAFKFKASFWEILLNL